MAAMVFVLSLRRAERRLVERLQGAGAAGPEKAVNLDDLGWQQRVMLRRLVWARAMMPAADKYYLDPAGYSAFRRRRRIRAGILLGGVLVLAGIYWLTH